ncbi:MAG: hypothetical protein ACXWVP_11440, partial [Burkholderiales bacterium]
HDEQQKREGDARFQQEPQQVHALLYSIPLRIAAASAAIRSAHNAPRGDALALRLRNADAGAASV